MNRSGIFWRPDGRWLRAGATVCGLAAGALFLAGFAYTVSTVSRSPEPAVGCGYLDTGRFAAFAVLSGASFMGIAGAVAAVFRPGLGAALMTSAGLAAVACGVYAGWPEGHPAVQYHVIGAGMLAAGALAYAAHQTRPVPARGDG